MARIFASPTFHSVPMSTDRAMVLLRRWAGVFGPCYIRRTKAPSTFAAILRFHGYKIGDLP